MAQKRMFTQQIIDSDAFLDMSLSAQALYFHLNMRADDDGFIDNPKKIQRLIGANANDLDLLIAKRFVLYFEDGVIVIKHWKLHNTIQKDRYKETVYLELKNRLEVKDNKAYTEKNILVTAPQSDKAIDVSSMDTKCIQDVNTLDTQIRLDLDKSRLDKNSKEFKNKGANASLEVEKMSKLDETLLEFEKMRIKIKKPITDRGKKLLMTELDKLAHGDDELKIAILNQSILFCYAGVFPLKNGNGHSKSNGTLKVSEWDTTFGK